MAVAPYRRKEVLGLAMADAAQAQPAPVSAGTDSGVIAVAPVSEIVPALLARARVIADLVERHSRSRRHRVGQLVERRGRFGVERLELAFRDHAGETRAWL